MQSEDYLDQYLEGWRLGDGAVDLSATAPGFYYDDPNAGLILREDFIGFAEGFKAAVAEMNGGSFGQPFLHYTDVVISEQETLCWWHASAWSSRGQP